MVTAATPLEMTPQRLKRSYEEYLELALEISWLWQEQLPNPPAALAEIMLSVDGLPADVRSAYQTLYNSLAKRH